MTVAELIEKLQQYPSNSEILLSIMPCTTKRGDLSRCGTYDIVNVKDKLKFIVISNHT